MDEGKAACAVEQSEFSGYTGGVVVVVVQFLFSPVGEIDRLHPRTTFCSFSCAISTMDVAACGYGVYKSAFQMEVSTLGPTRNLKS